jgi:hypothetical protein
VDTVPDPLLFFSGSAGNRTRASRSIAKNSDIDNIKTSMESLIDASNEISLEINVEKTKYMLLSRPRM